MTDAWSTPEHLEHARRTLRDALPGWSAPVVFAVGLSSATSSAETDYPHVNTGGQGELPALVLAHVVGHRSGTATYALTTEMLDRAVQALQPAEAAPGEHRNLWAWREILLELESNPMRAAYAVFIGDLADPVASEQEGSLRSQLPD